jgi:3,4-dihydroxy 2-butanone 4-phosphate synthase/GTP cyclohydrolase II
MRPIDKLQPQTRLAPEAIGAVASGRPVVIVSGPELGSVGMLTVPAQNHRASTLSFMAHECRGPVSLALTTLQCDRLGLDLVDTGGRYGAENMGTVEGRARNGDCPAPPDRGRTIRMAADPASGAAVVTNPGNVTVWRARDGGLIGRQGFAEAAIDLARAAGLLPAGLLCPILDECGWSAGLRDLKRFSARFSLPMVSIDELLVQRCQSELLLEPQPSVEQCVGDVRVLRIRETQTSRVHLALVKGRVTTADPIEVRTAAERPHADEHLWLVGALNRLESVTDGAAIWLDDGDVDELDSVTRRHAVTRQLVELVERLTARRLRVVPSRIAA